MILCDICKVKIDSNNTSSFFFKAEHWDPINSWQDYNFCSDCAVKIMEKIDEMEKNHDS